MASNIEIAQRGLEAYNRRDLSVMAELFHPDVEVFPAGPVALETRSYRGFEGVTRYLEEMAEIWDDLRIEVQEWREQGDRLIAFGRVQARGRGSGVELDEDWAGEILLKDSKITRVEGIVGAAAHRARTDGGA